MKAPKLVLVEWIDAGVVNGGWSTLGEIEREAESITGHNIRTAGHLVIDKPDHVVVGASWNAENDDAGQTLAIPRRNIVKITELRAR